MLFPAREKVDGPRLDKNARKIRGGQGLTPCSLPTEGFVRRLDARKMMEQTLVLWLGSMLKRNTPLGTGTFGDSKIRK